MVAARAVTDNSRAAAPRTCEGACEQAHPAQRAVCQATAVSDLRLATGFLGSPRIPLCGPCAAATAEGPLGVH